MTKRAISVASILCSRTLRSTSILDTQSDLESSGRDGSDWPSCLICMERTLAINETNIVNVYTLRPQCIRPWHDRKAISLSYGDNGAQTRDCAQSLDNIGRFVEAALRYKHHVPCVQF